MDSIKKVLVWIKNNTLLVLGSIVALLVLVVKFQKDKILSLLANLSLAKMDKAAALLNEKQANNNTAIKKEQALQKDAKTDLDKANKEASKSNSDYYNKRY